jgi:hypothetical protein
MKNSQAPSIAMRSRSEAQGMHSWIFRNRARLRVIYGSPPIAPVAIEPPAPFVAPQQKDAGQVLRRSRYVLLVPMPRRAG